MFDRAGIANTLVGIMYEATHNRKLTSAISQVTVYHGQRNYEVVLPSAMVIKNGKIWHIYQNGSERRGSNFYHSAT